MHTIGEADIATIPVPSPSPNCREDNLGPALLGNGRNTVSRALVAGSEEENSLSITEFWGKLGELCEKKSVSALCSRNSRLRGTHCVLSLELGEGKKLTELRV